MPDVHAIRPARFVAVAAVCLAAILFVPGRAAAQGFIGVSYGYNFGGDAGCRTATDCRNKSWNWGGALGSLGSFAGFEMELTHEGAFTGDRPNPIGVTTLMGDVMIGPKLSIVQPFGVIGFGAIRTTAETAGVASQTQTQAGWTIGGGLLLFVHRHVGLQGDVRYYHSFQTLSLLGIDLAQGQNKIDFGRAALGVMLKF